jgi:hypothetical protein
MPRCRFGSLLALFDEDGNTLAVTCLRHAGEIIWRHNKLIDRTQGAEPEDIRIHPLYREAAAAAH